MDPLSMIASVTGLLAVIAKVTTTVNDIAKKIGSAPESTRDLVNEISDLSVCLVQLQPFVRGTQSPAASRAAAISVEQVVAIVTSCVLNMSKLEEIMDTLQSLQSLQSRHTLTALDKMAVGISWAKRETEINRLMLRIRASGRSLNLILTIFNCNTSEEVQRSVHSLTTMVQNLLESSEDVSSRLANLEEKLARTAIPEADNIELRSVVEGMSLSSGSLTPNKYQQLAIGGQKISSAASEAASTMGLGLDPRIQRILEESRVYARNLHRHSISSMPWSYRSADGWSMLSGITLAQISNISVLSIPITASEVWGAGHYLDPSVSQSFGSDRALDSRRLRTRKLTEIIPRPPAGISQGFRRLVSPLVLDSDEGRRLRNSKEPGLLLLGMEQSGNSNVLMQMRIILSKHGIEWEERKEYRQILFSNMMSAFKAICEEMYTRGLGNRHTSIDYVALLDIVDDIGPNDPFPKACLAVMEGLWDEWDFQKILLQHNQNALYDKLHYCFQNRIRFFSKDYLPTNEDFLHTPSRSTGITETLLDFPRASQYRVFNVADGRSELKMCIHIFKEVKHLIFVVPLSAYNACLVKDAAANAMQEALLLFESLMRLSHFKNSTVFLMLNKLDLFKQKIADFPIAEWWPDYRGGDSCYAALCYFTRKFLDLNREPKRSIQVLYTDATNTETFRETIRRMDDVLIQDQSLGPSSYENDALLAAASTIGLAR